MMCIDQADDNLKGSQATRQMQAKQNRFYWLLLSLCCNLAYQTTGFTEPVLNINTHYYAIDGDNHNQLRAQLRLLGPRSGNSQALYAYTRWQVDWQYSLQIQRNQCRLKMLKVITTIDMTLPQWQIPGNISVKLAQRWQQFYEALLAHEKRHQAHGIAAGHAIEQQLLTLNPHPDCTQFAEHIQTTGSAIIQHYQHLDNELDHITRHGATQGVRF